MKNLEHPKFETNIHKDRIPKQGEITPKYLGGNRQTSAQKKYISVS